MDYGEISMLLRNIASGVIILYAALSAAARLGLVPGKALKWWHDRWQAELDAKERDAKIDALLLEMRPNGGASLRDAIDRANAMLIEHIRLTKPLTERFLDEHPDLR